jgi:YesN/AraC family two-component response regulator
MVTDVVMPGMDGLELGRHVARVRPSTKILYTSGYTEDITQDGGIDVVDYLQKPYTPSELGHKIRLLLA